MGDVRTEPSMEEILASIKRIIADDGVVVNGGRPRRLDPPPTAAAPPPPESILELTEAVMPAPIIQKGAKASSQPEPAPVPIQEPIHEAPPPPTADPAVTLVSDGVASASRTSLAALSSMMVRPPEGGDNTLDGLVRELLRPMLKEWLDARLPDLVESLVAREIARITGKAL